MTNDNYRELIGSLQCASLATRPDISFAVNKLAQFLNNPSQAHWETAMRALRYLKGTKKWSLNLGGRIADIAGYIPTQTRELTATIGSKQSSTIWHRLQF